MQCLACLLPLHLPDGYSCRHKSNKQLRPRNSPVAVSIEHGALGALQDDTREQLRAAGSRKLSQLLSMKQVSSIHPTSTSHLSDALMRPAASYGGALHAAHTAGMGAVPSQTDKAAEHSDLPLDSPSGSSMSVTSDVHLGDMCDVEPYTGRHSRSPTCPASCQTSQEEFKYPNSDATNCSSLFAHTTAAFPNSQGNSSAATTSSSSSHSISSSTDHVDRSWCVDDARKAARGMKVKAWQHSIHKVTHLTHACMHNTCVCT